MRAFVAFTLLMLMIAGFLLGFALQESTRPLQALPEIDLSPYLEEFKAGDYTTLYTENMLGKTGYFAVLDEQANIIYKSNPTMSEISLNELEMIPQYQQNFFPLEIDLQTQTGEPITLILRTQDEQTEKAMDSIILLDKDRKILYAEPQITLTQLTPQEYGYLTQTYPQGYKVWKVPLTSQQGETRWLVLYSQNSEGEIESHSSMVWQRTLMALTVMYLVVLIAVSLWLFIKVRHPLGILRKGISRLAEQAESEPIIYHGPQEFEDICASFNQLQSRLAESEAQRKQLEQGRQKMLADISHDLKTPITVMQGYSKAIRDNMVPPEKVPQYLDTIYQKSVALTDLINTFYEYSKLEHPDFSISPVKTDLCEFTREYLVSKYSEWEIAGIELEVDIPERPIWCMLDRVSFLRVYENITSNAVKHNPKGTKLYFCIKAKSESVVVQIADNGVGIPSELVANIFEPFVVGDESRNSKQGTGLGLAVSRKIVQAHGGQIELEASPAPWSTLFEITLPIWQ